MICFLFIVGRRCRAKERFDLAEDGRLFRDPSKARGTGAMQYAIHGMLKEGTTWGQRSAKVLVGNNTLKLSATESHDTQHRRAGKRIRGGAR